MNIRSLAFFSTLLSMGLAACSSSGTILDAGTDAGEGIDTGADAATETGPSPPIGGYIGTCGTAECLPGICSQVLCLEIATDDGGQAPWCGCEQYLDGGYDGATASCGNLACAPPCTCADSTYHDSVCTCP